MNCKYIQQYIDLVRSGDIAVCEYQLKLCDLVENVFKTEDIYVNEQQLEKYLSYQKYFPYRLFEWETFVFALHNCTYKSNGALRFPILFIYVGRGAGKNGYLAFEDFCLLTPTNGVKNYHIDIFAMSEEQAMQSWNDDAEKVKTGASMIRLLKKWYQTNSCESDWIVYDEIDVCSDALMQIVQGVVKQKDRKAAEAIYQILLKMLQVDFIDIENPFSPMLNTLCALPEYRKKVEEWLQYRQAVSTEYERRELAEQQFQILKRYGTPQEQNDFINRHLSNPEYRRMAIQNAIDAGDESTVERLALDGEYENQALPGLLQEWQKCRYHCYHRTGEREKLADVCEALLVANRIIMKSGNR